MDSLYRAIAARTYQYGGNPGVLNSVLANNSLVWETTSNIDYGFDIGFLDNRIELGFTGYNKLTSDRLYGQITPCRNRFWLYQGQFGYGAE